MINSVFLFQSNHQINQQLADRFETFGFQLDEDSGRLANHILNAYQVWLDKILGASSIKSPWQNYPIETFT